MYIPRYSAKSAIIKPVRSIFKLESLTETAIKAANDTENRLIIITTINDVIIEDEAKPNDKSSISKHSKWYP